jgi:hypothetical protein
MGSGVEVAAEMELSDLLIRVAHRCMILPPAEVSTAARLRRVLCAAIHHGIPFPCSRN